MWESWPAQKLEKKLLIPHKHTYTQIAWNYFVMNCGMSKSNKRKCHKQMYAQQRNVEFMITKATKTASSKTNIINYMKCVAHTRTYFNVAHIDIPAALSKQRIGVATGVFHKSISSLLCFLSIYLGACSIKNY